MQSQQQASEAKDELVAADSPGLVEVVDVDKREYVLAALLDIDAYGRRYQVRLGTESMQFLNAVCHLGFLPCCQLLLAGC